MNTNEKFLVTGASGFIGGWLVETLYLSGSVDVRAGIRSWSSAARLARFPIEIVTCDITEKEQVARAMQGATHVIHCAKGSREATVDGTRNMLEVASTLGVQHFVHISTTEVYGDQSGKIDESVPFKSIGQPYGDSKIEAEELCWEYAEAGLPVTVIRPSIVYGPFGKDWTVRLTQKLQSGHWGIFKGFGEGKCNLVYVSDLVAGILRAARSEQAIGQAFNISGPEIVSWNEYFLKFNSTLCQPDLKVIDPNTAQIRTGMMELARFSAKFAHAHFQSALRKMSQSNSQARWVMRSTGRLMKSTPRPQDLSLYNRDAEYVTAKSRDILGFSPRYNIDRGLNLTVCWLKHLGLVN